VAVEIRLGSIQPDFCRLIFLSAYASKLATLPKKIGPSASLKGRLCGKGDCPRYARSSGGVKQKIPTPSASGLLAASLIEASFIRLQ
jgi:hypothetical protein